jgi:acyl-CoA reductase-like NAD-dependent aldehyde dehydrogenase
MAAEVELAHSYLAKRLSRELASLTDGRTAICGPDESAAMMLPANITTFSVVEIARAALVGNRVRARLTRRVEPVSQLIQEVFDEALPGRVDVEQELSGPDFLSEALASESMPFVMVWGGEALGDELLQRVQAGPAKRVVFEGPGKDPVLVLAGACAEDVAVELIAAKFLMAGQTCTAPENVIVHQSLHGPITELLRAACERAQPLPMFSAKVPGIVRSQLEDALELGADVITGGRVEGQVVWPTVVTGVTPAMRLFQDETFAPVFALASFDSDEEAVALAQGTRFGLRAVVVGPGSKRIAQSLKGADYAEPVSDIVYGKYGMVDMSAIGDAGDNPVFGGYGRSGWVWDRGELFQGPKAIVREASVPAMNGHALGGEGPRWR